MPATGRGAMGVGSTTLAVGRTAVVGGCGLAAGTSWTMAGGLEQKRHSGCFSWNRNRWQKRRPTVTSAKNVQIAQLLARSGTFNVPELVSTEMRTRFQKLRPRFFFHELNWKEFSLRNRFLLSTVKKKKKNVQLEGERQNNNRTSGTMNSVNLPPSTTNYR
jgi:hypothetical protein